MKKQIMGGLLAGAAMAGFLFVFWALIFRIVPPQNKEFFNTSLIGLISFVSTAFGYYLGSSQSSARKTELAAQPPPAEPPGQE